MCIKQLAHTHWYGRAAGRLLAFHLSEASIVHTDVLNTAESREGESGKTHSDVYTCRVSLGTPLLTSSSARQLQLPTRQQVLPMRADHDKNTLV